MTARWFIALLLTAVTTSADVQAHPPGVADEDQPVAHEVEAFREFIARAIKKRDARALRALYADDFTHTHASGRVDGKDAHITSVLAGGPTIETAPVEELLYRVFGTHTIIVSGKSPIPIPHEGRTDQVRWMAVYVKVGGDWKIAVSQATRLP
ncbi:MAG TPA: nuclear transport factor 2 family protein [Xanthobacteraceae bacterium]|nr:nuclear transport factor 2 family protein [Xanthobacteraceae bacterium]